MRGRYPAGTEYVAKVEGSALAKERARVVLETLTGRLRVQAACQQLGIQTTRWHQVRHAALQALVRELEPGIPGRPARMVTAEAEQVSALEAALAEKELELQRAQVRAEVALILPQVGKDEPGPEKKTHRRRGQRRTLRPR